MDKYRQWAQGSQPTGPASRHSNQPTKGSVDSRQNPYNQGYGNRQNQPYQSTGYKQQSSQGNNQGYVDNRQNQSNQSNGGSHSINQQMEALQLRMQNARQENVAARQRVANQSIQGTQSDYIRNSVSVNRSLNDNRRNSGEQNIRTNSFGSSNRQFDDRSNKEQDNSNVDKSNKEHNNSNVDRSNKEHNNSNVDGNVPKEVLRDIEKSEPLLTAANLVEKGKQDNNKPLETVENLGSNTISTLKTKRKVKKEKIPVEPPPDPISNPYMQELLALAEKTTKTLDENKDVLGETHEDRKQKIKEQSVEFIEERRKKLRELLVLKELEADCVRLPLWKHKLNGEFDPPAAHVLKGKILFQIIVKSLIVMYIHPTAVIKKKRIDMRDRERIDLARTMTLYADATKAWLGKCVKAPLATLEQDISLDFEPRPYPLEDTQMFQHRMMQLKVRIKCIMQGLTSAEMPPDNITDFLVTLIDEDNYFPDNYLFGYERDRMEFSSLGGAVRLIVPYHSSEDFTNILNESIDSEKETSIIPVDAKSDLKNENDALGENDGDVTEQHGNSQKTMDDNRNDTIIDKNIVSLPGNTDKFDINRVRMLLQNFLLVRILVGNIVLSPWEASICRKPTKRVSKVIYNCRVAATVVYDIIQRCDESYYSSGSNSLPLIGGNTHGSESVKLTKTNQIGLALGSPRKKSIVPAFFEKIEANKNTSYFAKIKDVFFKSPERNEDANGSNQIRSDVESKLLIKRKTFETLTDLHGYLLRPINLKNVKALSDQYTHEYAESLDIWFTKILMHVLIRRDKKMKEKMRKNVP